MNRLWPMMASLCAALIAIVVQTVESHNPITTTVRFNREVAAVLNARCVPCHVEGGLAMPFQTYPQVRPWAVAIKEEVLARHMPPWPAEPGFGTFANDGGLTPREREFLVSWIDGGVPEGEGRPPAHHDHSGHWMLGEPDGVYVAVPDGNGTRPTGMTRFIVNTDLPQSQSISAIDVRMPDRRTARAAFVSLIDTGEYLGGWTPWHSTIELPGGVAFRVPAAARLAVDVLGTPTSEMEPPRVALYAADEERRVMQHASTLAIEAHTTEHHVRAREAIETTLTLVSFRVDMSPGGRSVELTARRPDGSLEALLWIKDFRHDWQVPFVLREPVTLPAGSVLQANAYFDPSRATGHQVVLYLTGYEGAQLPVGPIPPQGHEHVH